ncbi:MAG: hypothetical protein JSS82_09290 [Bacteroidetes bacterium]|nr:hypothetical protein [Bacteroidota bacterium]
MRKRLATLFVLLFTHHYLPAQSLLGYVGIGLGYDAFLPDKKVLPYRSSWPFEPGFESTFGLKYLPENGFEAFLNITMGEVDAQIPVPGYHNSHNYFKQFNSHITLGSGPQLTTDAAGTFVPYVHFGAAFYSDWGEQAHNSEVFVQRVPGVVSDTWALVCGAGLDWQFGSHPLSGLNLRLSYTPSPIYNAPAEYIVNTPGTSYDITMQGKMLQLMLTYTAHFTVKKWGN